MAKIDFISNRNYYWLRFKQFFFLFICLALISFLQFAPLSTQNVLILSGVILIAGIFQLFRWETRFQYQQYGLTMLPPGWGSFRPSQQMDDGRLASLYELIRNRWKPGGIIAGRPLPEHQILGLFKGLWCGKPDDRHMLTIAGSRAGKATGALIPNLLMYPGSALVIDPKGELAQITSRRRGCQGKDVLGQDVFILDPEEITVGLARHRWNPLAEMSASDPCLWGHASKMALRLIPMSPLAAADNSAYFETHARNVLTCLIVHVIEEEPEDRRNLLHIRKLIMQGDQELFDLVERECQLAGRSNPYADPHDALLAYLAESPLQNGKVRGVFQRLVSKADTELSGILGTLDQHTSFLDEHAMETTLYTSDFSLRMLKLRPTTIYICMRGMSLAGPLKKLMQIIIDQALDILESTPGRPPYPVLFMMDEFYCLQRNETLDMAIGQLGSAGITLWPVVQHISQLK
ncbi:type IV secretory system conjugative DNA transfer family protein, partial [Massilia sp. MS-15]|uniref:type IV secretory system conjugative DNA transfer family protein n=1 Tax=Massilia sp. MS-15 TaxID=2878200 RepID=UPI001CD5A34E